MQLDSFPRSLMQYSVLSAEVLPHSPLQYSDFTWDANHPLMVTTDASDPDSVPTVFPLFATKLDPAKTYSVWIFKGTEPLNPNRGAG